VQEVAMSQLNIYVPDKLEKKIKEAARKRKMSVSSFIAELVQQGFAEKTQKTSNKSLLDLGGTWEGKFPKIERGLPQEREE
jgi:hypothetical protein